MSFDKVQISIYFTREWNREHDVLYPKRLKNSRFITIKCSRVAIPTTIELNVPLSRCVIAFNNKAKKA